MPTTGTWRINTPPLQVPAVTGSVAWIAPGGGVQYAVIPDTLSGLAGTSTWTVPPEPGLYLDGSSTPVYISDLPPGWVVDDAYTAYFTCLTIAVGSSIQFAFVPLGISATVTSPPDNPPSPQTLALTGMTLLGLVGIFGFSATFTHTRNNIPASGGQCKVDGDTYGAFYFEGTYHIDFSWWLIPPKDSCGNAHTSQLKYTDEPQDPPYAPLDPDDSTAAPTPTIVSVTPNHGLLAGGTGITITGSGFGLDATVTLDGVAATGVTVLDQFTITATTPAHAAGDVDVVVTNPDGVSS